MSVGKDVSALFADVVNCVQSNSIEIKKLVYLYVVNYAKVQPELAILAVNTFRKDSLDPNPLIRALAVRTMGYIRLEAVVEYLADPIRRCCRDPDPYVRKTAAISIAKLYLISPVLVEEQGFIEILKTELLADANPMVVSNSAAALMEVCSVSPNLSVSLHTVETANILLNALNECTEWAQIVCIDAISLFYKPSDPKEARIVVERVCARLSHSNAAVVMSAIKLVVALLDRLGSADAVRTTCKKLAGPLITLLAESEPEIQYIALRNIAILSVKYPAILAGEVKVFFCKYNDPVYVKLEKLEAMVHLITPANTDQVLNELKEYATEIDLEFVRKSVRCIGRCAIRLESAADKCVNALLELIETKISYVVQEAVVVMRDVFRRFPNRFESVISALCDNLDSLDNPEAKSAMVWILGEYSDRIDNSGELLDSFMTNFLDEPFIVQIQLLTANIKSFLKNSSGNHTSIVKVLELCTSQSDNPDLRDRAFMYWRLLSADPDICRKCVLSQKPLIVDDVGTVIEPEIINKLIGEIGTIASVYHIVPNAFVKKSLTDDDYGSDDEARENVAKVRQALAHAAPVVIAAPVVRNDNEHDEEESDESSDDDSDDSDASDSDKTVGLKNSPICLVPASAAAGSKQTSGLQIDGCLGKLNGRRFLLLTITNRTPADLSQWAIQFNKNSFGLAPSGIDVGNNGVLPRNTSVNVAIPLEVNKLNSGSPPSGSLQVQIALKTNLDIFYFIAPFDLHVVLQSGNWQKHAQLWDSFVSSEKRAQLVKPVLPLAMKKAGFTQTATNTFAAITCNKLILLVKIIDGIVAVRASNIHVVPHAINCVLHVSATQQ